MSGEGVTKNQKGANILFRAGVALKELINSECKRRNLTQDEFMRRAVKLYIADGRGSTARPPRVNNAVRDLVDEHAREVGSREQY